MGKPVQLRSRPGCLALFVAALVIHFSPCGDQRPPSGFVPWDIAAGARGARPLRVPLAAAQGFGDPSQSKRQPKRMKIFAGMLTLDAPKTKKAGGMMNMTSPGARPVALAGRVVVAGGGVVAGLLALLYITSFFETLMHSTSGFLQGKSSWMAGFTGLAVGALHTVAGPDHLAGLAPLVVGQGHSTPTAFGLGALWGSGHATGQLLIGLACLAVHAGLLRLAWASHLEHASGLLVGAALVAIGLMGFYEARDYQESGDAPAEFSEAKKRRFGWATYGTGVLHGLSPDALIFIAPTLALSRVAGAFHVAGVVVGTLISMGCVTATLSSLCRRSPRLKLISSGAASVAVLLGVCIVAASLGLHVPLPGL